MRQKTMRVCALVSLSLMAGCVNIQRAPKVAPAGATIQGTAGTPAEHVHVSNYGYYLFNCIPIFCGNTEADCYGETVWFSDEVTLEHTQGIMAGLAHDRNCLMTEVQPQVKSTCFFGAIPYVGTTFGLLWYKEVQMSAVFVRPNGARSAKGGAR